MNPPMGYACMRALRSSDVHVRMNPSSAAHFPLRTHASHLLHEFTRMGWRDACRLEGVHAMLHGSSTPACPRCTQRATAYAVPCTQETHLQQPVPDVHSAVIRATQNKVPAVCHKRLHHRVLVLEPLVLAHLRHTRAWPPPTDVTLG